ncbi:pseudouridine synthase [Shewanella avicenniae]|uniref:Pseudouridine synthase n=1 Tax=Shewanella avicenniae TaxID=2814294 RepID=A0ABX7QSH1_9GAMM|nr:pseudouridine synthase [Shewanella avicenniae]QSX34398.1 pseudouridine synthase [Shewanella avicenniae]
MNSKRGRIDRFLASRLQIPAKQAQLLIRQGEVLLDGQACSAVDRIINEFTRIECQGQLLQALTPAYWMLHKPAGVVSATTDAAHQTVLSLLPDEAQTQQLHIAGRLDKQTTGLLLLTNDARWSEAISQPSANKYKHYRVTLQNPLTEAYVAAFAQGFYFDYEGITTAPAQLNIISDYVADVILTEGKYHQIKRMFGRFRNPVVALHRYQVGQIVLDDGLALGQCRPLTAEEIASVAENSEPN